MECDRVGFGNRKRNSSTSPIYLGLSHSGDVIEALHYHYDAEENIANCPSIFIVDPLQTCRRVVSVVKCLRSGN